MRDHAWLHKSPSLWLNKVAYICLKQFVCEMQVANASVECAVKDVQEYAHINRGPGDLVYDGILATDHRFIMAMRHSYSRTILMQYRLVIL